MSFLDKFTRTHRLGELQKARRWAELRDGREAGAGVRREGPGSPLPLADTMFILRHGKKAWRAANPLRG